MAALGRKLRTLEGGRVAFWCPGCDEAHHITVPPHPHSWGFNGDGDSPTFTPSIKVTGKRRITDDEADRIVAGDKIELPDCVCHSFVRSGRIEFLGDCTHALKGQTVDLPDFPA